MLPDLKRFTLRSILQQGYNKSLITSEKTFSSFLGKRLSHDTGRLWIAVGVTFPLEKARRRHGTLYRHRNDPHHRNDPRHRNDPQSPPK